MPTTEVNLQTLIGKVDELVAATDVKRTEIDNAEAAAVAARAAAVAAAAAAVSDAAAASASATQAGNSAAALSNVPATGVSGSLLPEVGHVPIAGNDGHINGAWPGDVQAAESYIVHHTPSRGVKLLLVDEDPFPGWIFRCMGCGYWDEAVPSGKYLGSLANNTAAAAITGVVVGDWYHKNETAEFYKITALSPAPASEEIFRAGTKHVPEFAAIVVHNAKIIIYDITTERMMMWKVMDFGGSLGTDYPSSTFNLITSDNCRDVSYRDGVIAIALGTPTVGVTGGLLVINLKTDRADLIESAAYGCFRYHGNLGQVNDGLGWGTVDRDLSIIHNNCYCCLLLPQADGDLMCYVGTAQGLSLIKNLTRNPVETSWQDTDGIQRDLIYRLVANHSRVFSLSVSRLGHSVRDILAWDIGEDLYDVSESAISVTGGSSYPFEFLSYYANPVVIVDIDADRSHLYVRLLSGITQVLLNERSPLEHLYMYKSTGRSPFYHMSTGYLRQNSSCLACDDRTDTITDANRWTGVATRGTGWSNSGAGGYACDGTQTTTSELQLTGLTLTPGIYLVELTMSGRTAGSVDFYWGDSSGTLVINDKDSNNKTVAVHDHSTTTTTTTTTTTLTIVATADFVGTVTPVVTRLLNDSMKNNWNFRAIGTVNRVQSAGDIYGLDGFTETNFLQSIDKDNDPDITEDFCIFLIFKDEGETGIGCILSNFGWRSVAGGAYDYAGFTLRFTANHDRFEFVPATGPQVGATHTFGKVEGDGLYHSVAIVGRDNATFDLYWDGAKQTTVTGPIIAPRDPITIGAEKHISGDNRYQYGCGSPIFHVAKMESAPNDDQIAAMHQTAITTVLQSTLINLAHRYGNTISYDPYTGFISSSSSSSRSRSSSRSSSSRFLSIINSVTGEIIEEFTGNDHVFAGAFLNSDIEYLGNNYIVTDNGYTYLRAWQRQRHRIQGIRIQPAYVLLGTGDGTNRYFVATGYPVDADIGNIHLSGALQAEDAYSLIDNGFHPGVLLDTAPATGIQVYARLTI